MSLYDRSLSDDMRLAIEFVKEVENHPCIYNVHDENYNNRPSTEEAWKEICQRFRGVSETDLKIKWRSVRSSYTRSFRTQKDYYLSPYLNFLLPYLKTRYYKDESFRKTATNDSDNSNDGTSSQSSASNKCLNIESPKSDEELDNDNDSTEINGKIQVKTLPELRQSNGNVFKKTKGAQSKILTQNQYSKSRLSPHECFLKSLMPDISAMNDRQFFNFRRGMLNIVGKIKYNEKSKIDCPGVEK